jgi:hypothetical protein
MQTRNRSLHLAAGAAPRERTEADAGLVWFTEECMNNGAPLDRYIAHAERIGDHELAAFFRRALDESHRLRPGDRRRWSRRVGVDRRRR